MEKKKAKKRKSVLLLPFQAPSKKETKNANRPLRCNRWRNKEGERLADFGIDEDAEFYDEDNLPLAEIMRRRQVHA